MLLCEGKVGVGVGGRVHVKRVVDGTNPSHSRAYRPYLAHTENYIIAQSLSLTLIDIHHWYHPRQSYSLTATISTVCSRE
jgi:hypothetical protein